MYAFPDMIEMGFSDDADGVKEFPSDDHRIVAINIGIGNSYVKDRDTLINIVKAVCKVPQDRIKTVTAPMLADEFGCPPVW